MPPDERPETRAAMVKDLLALIRDGKVPRAAEIFALAEPGLVSRIEEATRLEWLPSAPIVRLADAACTLVGPRVWRAVHRGLADDLSERALFRAVTRGMRVVFGRSLAAQCRIVPLVLNQAHRNHGVIDAVVDGPDQATIRILDCPPEGLSLGLLEVFAGTIEGLLGVSKFRAEVDVVYAVGGRDAALVARRIGPS